VTPPLNGPTDAATSKDVPFLRGVNLGGWLVLEKWMNSDVFKGAFGGDNIKDQYTFDGANGAAEALQHHWDTFFTEADIQKISETGINALRIPIGFWAYDNDGLPYQKGADKYLEKAIGWARKFQMKVWVDLHGLPGSQNGFDNSGQTGAHDWQKGNNLERSTRVLEVMAEKYGSEQYSDVVVGLELVNEPKPDEGNDFGTTQKWARDTVAAVRSKVANKKLTIIMHDSFKEPESWASIGEELNKGGQNLFGIDTHLYQVFSQQDKDLNQDGHIKEACGWSNKIGPTNQKVPVYVGEWSAASEICMNESKQESAGTSCTTKGCQCESSDMSTWSDGLVEQARRYVEAQLDTFEKHSHGYFVWSAKGPGPWSFMDGVQKGIFPNPVTSRKYPGQCNS
jgi:glucan 1,3-beta-glucosidase